MSLIASSARPLLRLLQHPLCFRARFAESSSALHNLVTPQCIEIRSPAIRLARERVAAYAIQERFIPTLGFSKRVDWRTEYRSGLVSAQAVRATHRNEMGRDVKRLWRHCDAALTHLRRG
mgnify:CR=1 FL=1